jgi:hypothetical protein
MSVAWRSSPDVFGDILRQHGCQPSAVGDVEAAWMAFVEFMQTQIDGIAPGEDSDADGFIVQWGRWLGRDTLRPYLSFTRQLAIPDAEDPERQPSYWQIELLMLFDDEPSLAGIDELNERNSGFCFEPIGPARVAELRTTRERYLQLYPQLHAVWHAKPSESNVSMENVC